MVMANKIITDLSFLFKSISSLPDSTVKKRLIKKLLMTSDGTGNTVTHKQCLDSGSGIVCFESGSGKFLKPDYLKYISNFRPVDSGRRDLPKFIYETL